MQQRISWQLTKTNDSHTNQNSSKTNKVRPCGTSDVVTPSLEGLEAPEDASSAYHRSRCGRWSKWSVSHVNHTYGLNLALMSVFLLVGPRDRWFCLELTPKAYTTKVEAISVNDWKLYALQLAIKYLNQGLNFGPSMVCRLCGAIISGVMVVDELCWITFKELCYTPDRLACTLRGRKLLQLNWIQEDLPLNILLGVKNSKYCIAVL